MRLPVLLVLPLLVFPSAAAWATSLTLNQDVDVPNFTPTPTDGVSSFQVTDYCNNGATVTSRTRGAGRGLDLTPMQIANLMETIVCGGTATVSGRADVLTVKRSGRSGSVIEKTSWSSTKDYVRISGELGWGGTFSFTVPITGTADSPVTWTQFPDEYTRTYVNGSATFDDTDFPTDFSFTDVVALRVEWINEDVALEADCNGSQWASGSYRTGWNLNPNTQFTVDWNDQYCICN